MGSVTLQSCETVVYVGDDKVQQGGVAIMMSARAKRALIDWTPISKRIVKARFYSRQKKIDSDTNVRRTQYQAAT